MMFGHSWRMTSIGLWKIGNLMVVIFGKKFIPMISSGIKWVKSTLSEELLTSLIWLEKVETNTDLKLMKLKPQLMVTGMEAISGNPPIEKKMEQLSTLSPLLGASMDQLPKKLLQRSKLTIPHSALNGKSINMIMMQELQESFTEDTLEITMQEVTLGNFSLPSLLSASTKELLQWKNKLKPIMEVISHWLLKIMLSGWIFLTL